MYARNNRRRYCTVVVLLSLAILMAACGDSFQGEEISLAGPAAADLSATPQVTEAVAQLLPSPSSPATSSLAPSPSPSITAGVSEPVATVAASPTATPLPSPTPQPRKIVVQSSNTSDVTVRAVTATPLPVASPGVTDTVMAGDSSMTVPEDAEPLIFIDFGIDQRCGHADIVAYDGHQLYATPRLFVDNSNFLAVLPEGSRVDLVDCRLWTDSNDVSWLVVRTIEKKLGWMIVQPDALIVTLYPVNLAIPQAVSGIPAGSTLAYVPPSACQEGPVTNEALATSIGVDFIPVVGDIKGLNEARTGCDMVTGESLGDWRWLGLLGIVGLSEVALLRHSDEIVDGVRIAENLEGGLKYSDEVAMTLGKNADIAVDVARAGSKVDNIVAGVTDISRAADGTVELSDEAVEAVAKFGQPCSFSAETLVATLLGPMPISQIKVGEMVLAFNERAQRTGYYPVVASFAHFDPALVRLGLGDETLLTTAEHPFYIDGEWVAAGDLAPGEVATAANGQSGVVEVVTRLQRPQVMYNLTVAEAHTYFVGKGEWLVHNACSKILRGNLSVPKVWTDNHIAWQAHHVIPGEFENSHSFVKRAIAGGWKIDDADNGIPLPYLEKVAGDYGLPAHRGSHPNYSSHVKTRLDELETQRVNENWSDQRAAQELEDLAVELEGYLKNLAGQRLN